ncbi:MAG: SMP-30/gluconolactonase/LRE family protein [bacterium]|nr:SMP-30/gluconolactonase/LRE family protein [bacterium]
MAGEVKIEQVAGNLVFPEGPVWHPEGYLIFSDIYDRTIQQLKPEGGTVPWFSQGIMTNGMIMSNDKKKVYSCCHSDLCLIEIDAKTREYKVLAKKYQGKPFNNVNDVAIDAEGNVYFTDPKWGAKSDDIQGIYCFNKDGKLSLAAELAPQPNGLVVSPDQKWLYVARSGAHDIWRFKLGKNGTLTDGKQWVKLEPDAEPDGMTIDSNGNLYVAQAGNGKICVLSPEGKVLYLVKVFDFLCTNCEFEGGNEKILYVTCAGKKELKQGAVYKLTFPFTK